MDSDEFLNEMDEIKEKEKEMKDKGTDLKEDECGDLSIFDDL